MSKQNLLEALLAQAAPSKKPTDKQKQILQSAIELFAEKGYANTSTQEIAKRAGVAEGTIFRHYGTKENLLLSVIVPFIKAALPSVTEEAFQEIMSGNVTHFEDFLRALLKNRIDFFKENKEIFQIVVKEMLYNPELRKDLQPYLMENIFDRVMVVVCMYKERGELIDLPDSTLQRLLFTFIGGYFVSRLLILSDDFINNEDEEIERIVQMFMNGLGEESQG